ncbi:replication initiator protein RepSA [Streptacidiphilus sp. MAP5-3]|uniref:replication initiator protein RepSA n=1 Tax=unclassified Streptacidiphilus TaxID=2643834 RepID=UPI0035186AB8
MASDILDPITRADLLRVATAPGFDRWRQQITRTGGCAAPIRLRGWTKTLDRRSGAVLHHYATTDEPGGVLRVACGNRRASRCPSCATVYAADTYHLIRAGLVGGSKGVGDAVRTHPRVFATLTAPSFGPVHNRPGTGRCRCGHQHAENDPDLGTALDPDTYDYATAVLWNNYAGELWNRFTQYLVREIAQRAGLSRSRLKDVARVSYAKVAEYQKRGAVHFHAVIRIDGPEGTDDTPPAWATVDLLTDAIRAAARRAELVAPAAKPHPARLIRWGRQLDVRPIRAFGDGSQITEQAVASYVAKYATKAAETTGTLDRRIAELADLDRHQVPDHARRLIAACLALDDDYPERNLQRWAHMLGFRGHFASKSRRYSTTLTAIRDERAAFRAAEQRAALGLPEPGPDRDPTTLTPTHWIYAGQGLTPGESLIAAGIAASLRENRETAREELAYQRVTEGEPTHAR